MLIRKTNPFLPLDLQYFSSEEGSDTDNDTKDQDATEDQDNQANTQKTNDDKTKDDKTKNDIMIPKTRFDQINEKYKAAQKKLDDILGQQKQAELDQKKQQGKFEELYTATKEELEGIKDNYKTASTRVEQLENVITSMLNTKLETIPEEFHDLIPENLTAEQKLDWISKAESKGLFADRSQEPLGGQTNPSQEQEDLSELTTDQLLMIGYGSKE